MIKRLENNQTEPVPSSLARPQLVVASAIKWIPPNNYIVTLYALSKIIPIDLIEYKVIFWVAFCKAGW